MGLAERADLTARLNLEGNFEAGIGRAQRALGGMEKSISKVRTSIKRTGDNLRTAATIGAGAFAGAVVASVKAAGDFEAQLNTINTVARATPEQLDAIGDAVRAIARDTGTPLEDLTQGYYDLVSAGIAAKDATGVLTAANRLAIGGLASTAETVDLLTTALNTYGADASKATEFSDIFAKAIERGKVTAADLAASFSQVGPIAANAGIELRELGAAYAQLTASGVPAAEASTQIRTAIVALSKPSGPLEQLQKKTKTSYLALAGKEGLVVALEQMRVDAKKAGIPLFDLLGRIEGVNFALATTGPNFADYNEDLAAMGKASGTAAAQMAERQKGLNFQLGRLKALVQDAGITIGSALLPKLVPLVDKLNEFITKNQGRIAEFGEKLATGFEKLAEAAGKVDFKAIGQGLEITGRAAKIAVDAFLALPPDIQKIAIAALAVNKVTGGLVTSGIGALAQLALSSLKTITAANVTVIGANVVSPGGGSPLPAAGGAAAGGAATGLGSVVVAGLAGAAGAAVLGAVQKGTQEAFRGVSNLPTDVEDAIVRAMGLTGIPNLPVIFEDLERTIQGLPLRGQLEDLPKPPPAKPPVDTTGNTDPQASSRLLFNRQGDTELRNISRAINEAQRAAFEQVRVTERAGVVAVAKLEDTRSEIIGVQNATRDGIAATNRAREAAFAIRDAVTRTGTDTRSETARVREAARDNVLATGRARDAAFRTRDAVVASGSRVAGAVNRKRLSVTVPVTNNFRSTTIINGRKFSASLGNGGVVGGVVVGDPRR